MTGTRFARTGRCRFFFCLGVLVLMCGMVAIFHSSQQQLDETREQRLRCEQQQEALNERLQSVVEQKFSLEKARENERNEQMEARRNLELKFKELTESRAKEQVDNEKLQQEYKVLQSGHNELVTECDISKKQQLENTNALEKKLQAARAELQKEQNVITLWREKYDSIVKEKERLEVLLNVPDTKAQLQQRIAVLARLVDEYQAHCDYKPKDEQQSLNKPLLAPDTTRGSSSQPRGFDKPRAEKSFNAQVPLLPKPLKKVSEETETQLKQQPDDSAGAGAAPAAAPPGNKIVSPLSAPRKLVSTLATKSERHVLEPNAPLKQPTNSSSTSSSNLPPLPMPPNQRKLPENVAPIPANFEELLKNEPSSQKRPDHNLLNGDEPAELDAAMEETKNDNDDANNNRYANVVNEMGHGGGQPNKAGANEDSGAHEVKDHDFINEQNFNLPAEDDNNFFDGGGKRDGVDGEKHKDEDNEDDDMMVGGAGDIAVKNQHHLLDADNLNNEVAGDQGKEFPDGLRMEDGGNDEDEDEDDYSNPAARQQGAQAIRN